MCFFVYVWRVFRVRSEWIKIQKGVLATGCPSHCFCRKIDFNACYNNDDKQIILFFHCRSSCNSQMRFNILSQT